MNESFFFLLPRTSRKSSLEDLRKFWIEHFKYQCRVYLPLFLQKVSHCTHLFLASVEPLGTKTITANRYEFKNKSFLQK